MQEKSGPEIRAVAFALSDSRTEIGRRGFKRARRKLEALAKKYDLFEHLIETENFLVSVVSRECGTSWSQGGPIRLILGERGSASGGPDRFLTVELSNNQINVQTDWAGSIPCFYTSGSRGLHISNLEPPVVSASQSDTSDIEPRNLYSFLRLSHLLWDETIWKHIKQVLPASTTTFRVDPGETRVRQSRMDIEANDERYGRSLSSLARELRDLNHFLVTESLRDLDEIVLPLSSGYDSRMILAALADADELKVKTFLRTYGPAESIEVKSAATLGRITQIDWQHVPLQFNFLSVKSIMEIHAVFGSSLPMHGMYQLEFVRQVLSDFEGGGNRGLTSGFMTGVPAGQHSYSGLFDFSQSRAWSANQLSELPIFEGEKNLESDLIEQSHLLFNQFNGSRLKKHIMLDVWTRQRNFISYYPRTLELLMPVRSPHMDQSYINFFLSIEDSKLDSRLVVEQMFRDHFPDLASVPSNSNNFRMAEPRWATGYRAFSLARRYFPKYLIPRALRDERFQFDTIAARKAGIAAAHPLLSGEATLADIIDQLGGTQMYRKFFDQVLKGDVQSYERLAGVQAVVLNFLPPELGYS